MRWLNSPPTATICLLALTATTALSPLASAGAADSPPERISVVKADPNVPASTRPGPILMRSSRLESRIVSFADSPDIPVTTASNTTQSENSVFVSPKNPLHLLNSNNSSSWPVTEFYGASYWVSTDGGLTWTGSTGGAGGTQRGDPAAAINRNGRLFVGYVSFEYGQGVAYSDNNGASWTPRTVAPAPSVLDKNHLWVDNSAASPHVNNVYSAWTNFQGGAADAQIEFMRAGGPTGPVTGLVLHAGGRDTPGKRKP